METAKENDKPDYNRRAHRNLLSFHLYATVHTFLNHLKKTKKFETLNKLIRFKWSDFGHHFALNYKNFCEILHEFDITVISL